jgi:hypothetical protein
MRDLSQRDIGFVSGGTDDPDLVLPTVTVTGSRRGGVSAFYSIQAMHADGGGAPGASLYLAREGGGGLGIHDPSPEDGIFGLRLEYGVDGNITWQVEVDGFFDVNPNGSMDPGEGPLSSGTSNTTSGGWGAFEQNMQLLETFTPLPPPAVPMM